MDPQEQATAIARVRQTAKLAPKEGPPDSRIVAAIDAFADRLDFWYRRVMQNSVRDYRKNIVARINPFIRRIEFEGLTASQAAKQLVEDYTRRNFVTAGGHCLEHLAIHISGMQGRADGVGMDLERHVGDEYYLYVMKSGTVTRNSDIVKALKTNASNVEKRLRHGGHKKQIHKVWAVASCKTSSTFEDGIERPSSAEFWAQMTGLDETKAVALTLAIAEEAGKRVQRDTDVHLEALEVLVGDYIADRTDPTRVDWDFVGRRNMATKDTWKNEDKDRDRRARDVLAKTGYVIQKRVPAGKEPEFLDEESVDECAPEVAPAVKRVPKQQRNVKKQKKKKKKK